MMRWTTAAALACLLGLAGCGTPIIESPGGEGGPFPHEENYSRLHMDDAEVDDSVCFGCHAVDEDSLEEDGNPLHCTLCHAYPPVHMGDDDDSSSTDDDGGSS